MITWYFYQLLIICSPSPLQSESETTAKTKHLGILSLFLATSVMRSHLSSHDYPPREVGNQSKSKLALASSYERPASSLARRLDATSSLSRKISENSYKSENEMGSASSLHWYNDEYYYNWPLSRIVVFSLLVMMLIDSCRQLIQAYHQWLLGDMTMPEDVHPDFGNDVEARLCFFTLPMALNYQRNSYTLRESATQAYQDPDTSRVFDPTRATQAPTIDLQTALVKHKVALQPNKYIKTRQTISQTIHNNRWSITWLLEAADYDVLQLQQLVQITHKRWFPYLSWPKIFHYRCYILWKYCDVTLSNRSYIQVAPDTHVIQCSIKLWVITETESDSLTRDQISDRRRSALAWSGIDPIDMHSPLWFWSRNGFSYQIQ